MADRFPRKFAAILYADVAGYSRLTEEDEIVWPDLHNLTAPQKLYYEKRTSLDLNQGQEARYVLLNQVRIEVGEIHR